MAKSMTGYGRGSFQINEDSFAVEVKALNHRFIDVSLRSPERFIPLELKIREEVKRRFSRGSFSLFISFVSSETPSLKVNLDLARAYIEAADTLRRVLGAKGEADIPVLLKLKDIFAVEKKGPLSEADWGPLKAGLEVAFGQLEAWRVREGHALNADLLSRLDTLEAHLKKVEASAPASVEAYRARLKDEMEKVLRERVDESRILLEAAVFAERTDVTEEITRLKSHLDMFRKFLQFDEPVGKRLDFLCQEIGREINTIGSKANDVGITQTVIEMKGEAEKIREQVQNVE